MHEVHLIRNKLRNFTSVTALKSVLLDFAVKSIKKSQLKDLHIILEKYSESAVQEPRSKKSGQIRCPREEATEESDSEDAETEEAEESEEDDCQSDSEQGTSQEVVLGSEIEFGSGRESAVIPQKRSLLETTLEQSPKKSSMVVKPTSFNTAAKLAALKKTNST